MKVVTVADPRPEIIRVDATLTRLGKYVFVEDLGLRRPDHFLQADTSSLGAFLGSIMQKTEEVLLKEKPNANLRWGIRHSTPLVLLVSKIGDAFARLGRSVHASIRSGAPTPDTEHLRSGAMGHRRAFVARSFSVVGVALFSTTMNVVYAVAAAILFHRTREFMSYIRFVKVSA